MQEDAKEQCNRPHRQETVESGQTCTEESTRIRIGRCSLEGDDKSVEAYLQEELYRGYRIRFLTAHQKMTTVISQTTTPRLQHMNKGNAAPFVEKGRLLIEDWF
jgi:hypothetical protein